MTTKSNSPKTYVLGQNISHSKSPLIHNYWLKKYGLNGSYEIKDIAPNQLQTTLDEWRSDPDFVGCNVTMPYKQSVMPLLDDIEPAAKMIGAVNTIYLKGGKFCGTNTDAYGFMSNLKSHLSDEQITHLRSKKILVLGAGGAARAILYGLISEGFSNVNLTNRSVEKAQNLATHYKDQANIEVIDWADRDNRDKIKDIGAIINTTSLGMIGEANLDFEMEALDSMAIVVDIVYTPLYTELLKKADAKGLRIVTGIGMLLYQAQPAFELFFGTKPALDLKGADHELERLVLGQ
jgi:shikimate dehydrogenase